MIKWEFLEPTINLLVARGIHKENKIIGKKLAAWLSRAAYFLKIDSYQLLNKLFSKNPIEEPSQNHDEKGYCTEENANQSPSHHFLQHSRFGQGEAHNRHHKCNCLFRKKYIFPKKIDRFLKHRHFPIFCNKMVSERVRPKAVKKILLFCPNTLVSR